jgi:hypothetical chaperone protein
MFAGLDFGTSNCEIGIWQNGSPRILKLEGDKSSIPSTMYAGSSNIDPEEIEPAELQDRLQQAYRQHMLAAHDASEAGEHFELLGDDQLKAIVLGRIRREQMQSEMDVEQANTLAEALAASDRALFGEEAVAQHSLAPDEGFFVKSPKSFLGTELRFEQIETYSEIITKMMANIKATAERQIDSPLTQVVVGRPVNFHSSDADKGNAQAISILERAAVAAGYDDVSFMYEPVAAALDYERNIDSDQKVLVLDFGGGTTDCSMVLVGPSYRDNIDRNSSILSYTGDRVGGNDLDMKLAFHALMPYFGSKSMLKNGLSVPSSLFWDAVATNDIPAQTRFRSAANARHINQLLNDCDHPELIGRFKTLQNGHLSYRINRSAELSKIQLSATLTDDVALDYIEQALSIAVTREQFSTAIERELRVCRKLIVEAEAQAGEKPDVIYVTGGTAKSPIIEGFIKSLYSDREIIIGDHFGSVASGLTAYASRKYG